MAGTKLRGDQQPKLVRRVVSRGRVAISDLVYPTVEQLQPVLQFDTLGLQRPQLACGEQQAPLLSQNLRCPILQHLHA